MQCFIQLPLKASSLSGLQRRSGRSGEDKNTYSCQELKPVRPARSIIMILIAAALYVG